VFGTESKREVYGESVADGLRKPIRLAFTGSVIGPDVCNLVRRVPDKVVVGGLKYLIVVIKTETPVECVASHALCDSIISNAAVGINFGWRVIEEVRGILEEFVINILNDTDIWWYFTEPIVASFRGVAWRRIAFYLTDHVDRIAPYRCGTHFPMGHQTSTPLLSLLGIHSGPSHNILIDIVSRRNTYKRQPRTEKTLSTRIRIDF
jgi:hypothetical protein